MSNVISIRDHQAQAWEAYMAAQRLAQSTGNMDDGIAAGKAWRRWLDLFVTEEQRAFLGRKSA